MIVTVTLNPTTDIVSPVHSLQNGKVFRSKNIFSYPGGKGTNTARALAALGANVIAAGFIGNKNSQEMNSFLTRHKIRPDFLAVPGSNRTCLLISEDNGTDTVINSESNIRISVKARAAMLSKLKSLSKKADIFVFSGSLPLSVPESFYVDCIKAVRQNATVILDTSSKYLKHGIKARPHIIKQNIHELESAFGVRFSRSVGTAHPAAAAEAASAEEARAVQERFKRFISVLSKKYCVNIIITTLNEKGSVLFDNGRFTFLPPVKVKKVVSPVGSGDAYSAGLAFGIEDGMTLPQACKFASACAAANLGHLGSCFLKTGEINRYL
jgi:1-phosphofructokinase family hexose kinase